MRRTILLLALMAMGWCGLGRPALAHDVKDPVCRMLVDSDTTKFKQKLGNKSFYFCSRRCQESFASNPAKYEQLAEQLEKQDLHEYAVDLETRQPPVAGKPVQMTLALQYADSKALVRQFEVVHERFLHLLMVSEDLSWFEHQHPVRGEDGRFRLTWTFPRPGRYRLYADFTPADGDNQVKQVLLTVGGGSPRSILLAPDRARVKRVGEYQVELRVQPQTLRMERPTLLTFTFRDRRGRPVRDMQPYIGAMGHLIAISQDGEQVVHTHVLQATTHAAMENEPLPVTPDMVTETGPTFTFKLTLPTGGLYKTWAQFMRDNRVITVPFTFQVEGLWDKTTAATAAPPDQWEKTAGAALPAKSKQHPSSPAPHGRGLAGTRSIQRATIVIDGGYSPATVSVKAKRPVQLTFIRKETSGCGDVVQFPSLSVKRTLKPGEKTVISFTPAKPGTIPFTCGMGMYRGQVVVK
jgi:YHS domain-containing protein